MCMLMLCWAFLAAPLGQEPTPAPPSAASPAPKLDFEFFKTKVQPIFLAKRPGHARCVACHGSPDWQILHLQPLPPGRSSWNDEESRKNFEAAKVTVIPGNLKSPLLTHPLAETAGGDFFHSGGKHFMSQNDPEWQVLRDWVMGKTAASGN